MASQELLKGIFPTYNNRAEYRERVGAEAPEFDPHRKIKRWFDSAAGEDGLPEVIYPNAVMMKPDGVFVLRNGRPIVRPLVLTVAEAATVNLPPEDAGGNTGDVSANLPEIQNPFRDLQEGEELMVAGPDMGLLNGQALIIRNTRLWAEEQAARAAEDGKFTSADRRLLYAIAAKLGVTEEG